MGSKVLIFGSNGSIGSFLKQRFEQNHTVVCGPRNSCRNLPQCDVVLWCQGVNTSDSIQKLDYARYEYVMDGNLHFVTRSLSSLLSENKINDGARLCVISSIWQEHARPDKFSYMVSKSALRGLVQSVAVDLLDRNIFINAILPGPLDTPMTRMHLSSEQIQNLPGLVNINDIYHIIDYLCFKNSSMTGQCIKVDCGLGLRPRL